MDDNEENRFISLLKGTYSEYIFDQIVANLTGRKDTESIWYSIDEETRARIKSDAMLIIEQAIDRAYINATMPLRNMVY